MVRRWAAGSLGLCLSRGRLFEGCPVMLVEDPLVLVAVSGSGRSPSLVIGGLVGAPGTTRGRVRGAGELDSSLRPSDRDSTSVGQRPMRVLDTFSASSERILDSSFMHLLLFTFTTLLPGLMNMDISLLTPFTRYFNLSMTFLTGLIQLFPL